ncbi:hypothetical protein HanRHA438_Chr15g0705071 [Helianthus annuus]|uniref:Uncharacterized protein n=1 Tax=Helianthus annuus TaxID=4232 RepID=A0A251S975_HELAN|nr:uncharacterized protein LOC110911620 [Helianthus annuus]KAF5764498.1 hypothetical protein HanXRQr2_Chr15g0692721 [Helianthus annuus]KAJ0451162.1 hypothetical protein HanHA300_Chr15g0564431 [Helianthus annuus]KAJ0455581.1 hypothetical protein HanIR_Chr15g0752791 [Helianthus annuus]KAJ0473032.1 hypothetical protein HanHA89_Chr15g0613721 [Helianthus annuus]KAJ0648634.1 hypothetical protein HanLR1_Chr15g0575091 [Helianthus annuus]
MKFFFPELGFCFGGTVVTPTTEIICTDVSTTRRRVRHGKFTKHWKPELSAIAEDGGVLNARRQSHESLRSEKKLLNKTRSAGKTRSHSFSSGDYRKYTQTMAIPAFSPTPFVF